MDSPPPRIVYVCSLCLRQYDLHEDLRGHMMLYHDCHPMKSATKPSAKSKELSDAMRDSSSPPPPTDLQPMPFKDFRIVLRGKQEVPCTANSTCSYKFESVEKMEMHAKCHKDSGYGCSECGLGMPTWRRCSLHLWKAHQLDADLLQCPVTGCGYKSPISALVWRHMRVHRSWRSKVMRRQLLRVRVQKRRQQQQQQQKQQQQQHQEQKQQQSDQQEQQPPQQSPQEPTTDTQQSQLSVAATVKKNKYYAEKTCEICQRKFVNGKTLSKHVKTVHNKIKPFICSVCGKKTARKASLIIHMRQHTGEKPLKCERCKFATRDPSSLYKHRQRHRSAAQQQEAAVAVDRTESGSEAKL